jgi:hypothetical protein
MSVPSGKQEAGDTDMEDSDEESSGQKRRATDNKKEHTDKKSKTGDDDVITLTAEEWATAIARPTLLTDIALDTLLLIISFLSVVEQATMHGVNKELNQAYINNTTFFALPWNATDGEMQSLTNVTSTERPVDSLYMGADTNRNSCKLSAVGFECIYKRWPTLKRVSAQNFKVADGVLVDFVCQLQHLERLALRKTRFDSVTGGGVDPNNVCREQKVTRRINGGFTKLPLSLQNLILMEQPNFTQSTLDSISRHPNIHSLELNGCCTRTRLDFRVLHHMPKLKKITYINNGLSIMLLPDLRGCTKLKCLIISQTHRVLQLDHWAQLVQLELEELSIASTPIGFSFRQARPYPGLRTLKWSGIVDEVNVALLLDLTAHVFPNVTCLDLRGNNTNVVEMLLPHVMTLFPELDELMMDTKMKLKTWSHMRNIDPDRELTIYTACDDMKTTLEYGDTDLQFQTDFGRWIRIKLPCADVIPYRLVKEWFECKNNDLSQLRVLDLRLCDESGVINRDMKRLRSLTLPAHTILPSLALPECNTRIATAWLGRHPSLQHIYAHRTPIVKDRKFLRV